MHNDAAAGTEVAVVGVACWYPGARDVRELWEGVLGRRREFRLFPKERTPLADYFDTDRSAVDKFYMPRAGFIDGFVFDWAKYRIPQSTFAAADIVQWLALEIAARALEDAGYRKNEAALKDRTGVFVGNTCVGEQARSMSLRLRWPFVRKVAEAALGVHGIAGPAGADLLASMEEGYKSVLPAYCEDSGAGGISATIAGRVCNYFDFHGGAYSLDGACASSLLAVYNACELLVGKKLDFALAGGVDVSLDPNELVAFSRAGALASEEIRPFDRRGDGFVPGEGCGFVGLKRLADARRDGDPVYAVLKGWGMSTDGKSGIMQPTKQGQLRAIRRAYEGLGYGPGDVHFVEAHGTGTRAGDKVELEGIAMAIGEGVTRKIGVTSLKSTIGHTKAAAGVGGLIKAVAAVNRRVVPPTAGCEEPHGTFDQEAKDLYPVLLGEVVPPDAKMRAGVSSFGFGGLNTHITLESGDAPSPKLQPRVDERALLVSTQDSELVVCSAASGAALQTRLEALAAEAEQLSSGELVDFAAHCARTVDRAAALRAAVVATSPRHAAEQLRLLAARLSEDPQVSAPFSDPTSTARLARKAAAPTVGFLLPGQGSQQLAMGRVLVERFAWARELLEQADAAADALGTPRISQAVFPATDSGRARLPDFTKALAQTEVAQPAICLTSVLYAGWLSRLGVKPVALAGHSLGELTALHLGGAYDAGALFRLAALRGQLMGQKAGQGGAMASLACSETDAAALLTSVSGLVVVANINGPRQTVISGEVAAVEAAMAGAAAAGVVASRLPVSNAFHSPLMATAAETLEREAPVPQTLGALAVPVVSSVDAQPLGEGLALRTHLGRQVLSPVRFAPTLKALAARCDVMVELAPGRILSGLAESVLERPGSAWPVAAKANVFRELNATLAMLFARGAELDFEPLFEQRLVRPHVPPAERLFFKSPTEAPLQLSAAAGGGSQAGAGLPLAAALRANGFTDAAAGEYLAQRGAFLAGVARVDLESMRSAGALARPAAVAAPAARSAAKPTAAAVTAGGWAGGSVQELLIELIVKRTGFPKGSIAPGAKLLDDLNIDSIKAGELVATAAKTVGAAGKVDAARFANATVSDIAAALSAVAVASPAPSAVAARPVEKPALAAPAVAVATDAGGCLELLVDLIARRTGFPKASIGRSAKVLDDLNIDSIKAGEIIASAAKAVGAVGKVDPARFANAALEDIAAALAQASASAPAAAPAAAAPSASEPAPQGVPGQAAAAVVLAAAHKLTGYRIISLDSRVFDDLNLSEQKLHQLLAQACQTLELPLHFDLQPLHNARLRHIAGLLERMREQRGVDAAPLGLTFLEQQADWARNYAVKYVEQPLTPLEKANDQRTENNWREARVLLVAERAGVDLAEALQQSLSAQGAEVKVVGFAEANRGELAKDVRLTHLVAILPEARAGDDLATEARTALERLLSIARVPPASSAPRRRTTVAYVQFGQGTFGTDRATARPWVERCASAFARSLSLERDDLRVRVIDLPRAMPLPTAVSSVTAELVSPVRCALAGYDTQAVRRVPRLEVHDPSRYPARSQPLAAGEVVLVTAGGKGIVSACALALAEKTKVTLALVGRSSASSDPEVAHTLARLRALGVRHRYYACDVTQPEAVRTLVSQVRAELGPVRALVHGSGAMVPRRAEKVTVAGAMEEVSAKVVGAGLLLEALEREPLKLVVGISSISGVTGGPGNTTYSWSNEVLSHLMNAFHARHPETQALSVAFSLWAELGVGARFDTTSNFHQLGLHFDALPPEVGAARFVDLLTKDPGAAQVVVAGRVMGRDLWSLFRPAPAAEQQGRFLDEVLYQEPGVELVSRAHLTHARDVYLKDCSFNGTCLMPGVHQLEAVAQAATVVMQSAGLPICRIEDVAFLQPIAVGPEQGCQIEVHALAREQALRGERSVDVVIRAEHDGFKRACCTATVVFGARASAPQQQVPELSTAPLGGAMAARLETVFCMKGERTLGPLYAAGATRAVWETEARAAAVSGEEGFAGAKVAPLTLGDPFAREAMLVTVAFCGSDALVVTPLRIDRLELFAAPQQALGRRGAVAELKEKTAQTLVADAWAVDRSGAVVERVSGMTYRIHGAAAPAPRALRPPPTPTNKLARPSVEAQRKEAQRYWPPVRDYRLTLERAPLAPGRDAPDAVLVLCEAGDDAAAQALAAALARRSVKTRVARYGEQGPAERHRVALLPARADLSSTDALSAAVARLLAAVPVALGDKRGTAAFVQLAGGTLGVGDGAAASLSYALSGFATSLHEERSDLKVRVVDLSPALGLERAAEAVAAELCSPGPYAAAGYDPAGERHQARLELLDAGRYPPRRRTFGADDVVVVTGGARGITAQCALALAQHSGATLALLGRSPLLQAVGELDEISATLAEFKRAGVRHRYYACDITETDEVDRTVARVRAELGPITGVIHGAGLLHPRSVAQLTPESSAIELSSKVLGAWQLCRALERTPPKLFLAWSSIGQLGASGTASYALSNQMLDFQLRAFGARHPETDVLAVGWGLWAESRAVLEESLDQRLGQMGITLGTVHARDAVERMLTLAQRDCGTQSALVVGTVRGLQAWERLSAEAPPAPTGLRFIEQVVHHQPGVELTARARLTVARDTYLNDHVFRGMYVVPTVLVLEALAQAATALAGGGALEVTALEDVELPWPIVVSPDEGEEIELRAVLDETARAPGERSVRVTLRAEKDGFQKDFALGRVLLGRRAEAPLEQVAVGDALPLEPKTDLYGRAFFVGPRYQRMQTVHAISESEAVCRGRYSDASARGADVFSDAPARPLVLGDPYFHDTLLHTAGLRDLQLSAFVQRLSRLELYRRPAGLDGEVVCRAQSRVSSATESVTELTALDEQGRPFVRVHGFCAHIFKRHLELPTTQELKAPEESDQTRARLALTDAARRLAVVAPALALARGPEWKKLSTAERRAQKQPLLARVLTAAGADPASATLTHDAAGRPALQLRGGSGLQVSFTHDGPYCVAVCQSESPAVDLQAVTARSREAWLELLGPARAGTLDALVGAGEGLDRAGTRLWCAAEAMRKLGTEHTFTLELEKADRDAVLLVGRSAAGTARLLTVPVQLLRGGERVLAAAVTALATTAAAALKKAPAPQPLSAEPAYQLARRHDPSLGCELLEHVYPLSRRDCTNPDQTAHLAHYGSTLLKLADALVGTDREAQPAARGAAEHQLTTVIQRAAVQVLGDATANESLLACAWASRLGDGGMQLLGRFFNRRTDQLVAEATLDCMLAGWAQLPDGARDELARLLEQTFGRYVARASAAAPVRPSPAWLEPGAVLFEAPAGPGAGRALGSHQLVTTSVDTDYVGNVHSMTWVHWQTTALDLFLRQHLPQLSQSPRSWRAPTTGGLRGVSFSMDYFKEVFPFETVSVELVLERAFEHGAQLRFEYFRLADGAAPVKVAVGRQEVRWVTGLEGRAARWPEPVLARLLDASPPAREPSGATLKGGRK
ncbi:MAG: SDR family NAD(P)-dependent oxidoreductase [Archangiaceae bacterium]|nr:SDR family NAD(P)-dependent oxidoreductase [Archangiaceae bacterium]